MVSSVMNCSSKHKLDYKEKAKDIYSRRGAENAKEDQSNGTGFTRTHVTLRFLLENRMLNHQYRLVYRSGKNMLSLIGVDE